MRRLCWVGVLALLGAGFVRGAVSDLSALRSAFANPSREARLHCYWWWLNGHTDEATITRDLEQMKAKGYGGVILIDANGSNQNGNRDVAAGPLFGSSEWRRLYRHAVAEAARLGLEMSLTIQSGWNLGGPGVQPSEASKVLTFSRLVVSGDSDTRRPVLPQPASQRSFYRDIAVLAYPLHAGKSLAGAEGDPRHPIRLLQAKAAFREFGRSMPVTTALLEDDASQAGEADCQPGEVQDITSSLQNDGSVSWRGPAGDWELLRIGYTDSGAKVSTSSGGWQGLAIDHMDHRAFESYWAHTVAPLVADAQPYVGKSLRYLVTDSWELGGTNWSAPFRAAFKERRGYDLLPFLPVVSGRIVGSRDASDRFLNDFRKTIGDLIRSEHYAVFARMAKENGLGIHPESGGPHGAPIDALRTLALSTFPQTEFWAKSPTHRSKDEDRFFVKEAASSAHISGKAIVAGEGFTSIGPQWEEVIWNDLKPTFDQAVCSGLNLLFWHTFTSSPKAEGLPGQEYFAGSHLNPNVTWFQFAGPFLAYINRNQAVLQQGVPVADVLYYYGDRVPNFVQLQAADPAHVLPGYDYDVTDEETLVAKAAVRDGRVFLPGGASYRVLAMGNRGNISLAALRKIRELAMAGAIVVGGRPDRTTGLTKGVIDDSEVKQIAGSLWGACEAGGHAAGRGRVFCGDAARPVLEALHGQPDFEYAAKAGSRFDYTHRRAEGSDIYFVRSDQAEPAAVQVTLRTAGRAPELWHADSGEIDRQPRYSESRDGRLVVPLALEPYGSVMVVVRPGRSSTNFVPLPKEGRLLLPDAPKEFDRLVSGEWTVHFPAGWGAPAAAVLPELASWTANQNAGIRYFSGTAIYSKEIEIPAEMLRSGSRLWLDLGDVRELAQVRLNGQMAGIAWKRPFRVALGSVAHAGVNRLEIAVANLWPNRIIGDQSLPPERRFTHTNIAKFKADSPLLPSGLLGPVRLVAESAR